MAAATNRFLQALATPFKGSTVAEAPKLDQEVSSKGSEQDDDDSQTDHPKSTRQRIAPRSRRRRVPRQTKKKTWTYLARRILAETPTNSHVLVDWHGNDEDGLPCKPTLTKREDATITLLREWEEEKRILEHAKRGTKGRIEKKGSSKGGSKGTKQKKQNDHIDSSSEYEIERLVNHVYVPELKETYFLVQWKGFSDTEDLTWEPGHALMNALDVLQQYRNDVMK